MRMSKRESLVDMGYEDSVVFENPDYDDAIIGVTTDGGVVYDYSLMVSSLAESDNMSEEDAVDFIDYNTVRSIPYAPDPKPVIIYKLVE